MPSNIEKLRYTSLEDVHSSLGRYFALLSPRFFIAALPEAGDYVARITIMIAPSDRIQHKFPRDNILRTMFTNFAYVYSGTDRYYAGGETRIR